MITGYLLSYYILGLPCHSTSQGNAAYVKDMKRTILVDHQVIKR